MVKEFKYNWCDYLTQCNKFPNIQVGSYECTQCDLFKYIKHNETPRTYAPGDYSRYFDVNIGTVECDD